MAYQGYLVKMGNYTLPLNYIQEKGYKGPLFPQDMNSYRDANGLLHRNVLEHEPIKLTIKIKPLTNTNVGEMMKAIRANYLTKPVERKLSVTAFVPELNDYITQNVYMKAPEFPVDYIEGYIVHYESTELILTGY